MKKKTALRKTAAKKSVKVARRAPVKYSLLDRALSKRHWPFHGALLGAALVLFKGLFAVVGLGLILVAVFTYIHRAAKSAR